MQDIEYVLLTECVEVLDALNNPLIAVFLLRYPFLARFAEMEANISAEDIQNFNDE